MWGDQFCPRDTAGDIRREREARERKAAERTATATAALAVVLPRAEAGDVAAMNDVIRHLGTIHDFTIETRTVMPEGAAAFAEWGRRNIVIPPIVDQDTFATALHEAGHIVAGKCPRRAPHQPDPTVKHWHHCLSCETSAWANAMRLAPFTRVMHQHLRSSLLHYRRKTPGPTEALEQLDHVAGTVAWALDVQRRRKWQDMVDKTARAMAESRRSTR